MLLDGCCIVVSELLDSFLPCLSSSRVLFGNRFKEILVNIYLVYFLIENQRFYVLLMLED